MIRGVIFDFDGGLVHERTATPVAGIPDLLTGLQGRGIAIGAMSGQASTLVDGRIASAGLPLDVVVTTDVPNAKKGGGNLIRHFARQSGLALHEVAAVVADDWGYREAVNSPVISFRAGWAGYQGKYSLRLDAPHELLEYLDLFFRKQHLWFGAVDGTDQCGREVRLRALLDGNGAGSASMKSMIYKALKLKEDTQSNGVSFSSVLVMHLIASLYLEGLLCDGRDKASLIIYPGHDITSSPPPLVRAALDGLKFVRMSIDPGGLVRWSRAVHSSRSRIENRRDRVRFVNQPSSIYIPAKFKVEGKRLLVLDDFTTAGYSLESARNMLLEAGAERVTMVAFGKYHGSHTVAVPEPAGTLKPREQRAYSDADFKIGTIPVTENPDALTEFLALVAKVRASSIGSKLLT